MEPLLYLFDVLCMMVTDTSLSSVSYSSEKYTRRFLVTGKAKLDKTYYISAYQNRHGEIAHRTKLYLIVLWLRL
jgi:hypothetical protein